jgi:hypothetical protein
MTNPQHALKYQILLFQYPTSQPFLVTSSILRRALWELADLFQCYGHEDGTLRRTTIVGHSLGGIVAKMACQTSKSCLLWRECLKDGREMDTLPPAIEELGLSRRETKLLKELLIFDAVPFIHRVVFIASPHNGVQLARYKTGFLFEIDCK